MALFRKFFYRKPPDSLLEIAERVYVFNSCFTTDALEENEYKAYVGSIVTQLREHLPDACYMVFNFREGDTPSQISNILSEFDMTVMDYPRQYEGCPLLTMEMIHHFLRSSESWLSLGQQNVLLMHCERGGWPVLAFMLASLLIYRKQYSGEQKTLDTIYKQAPHELLQLLSPLNPLPSQLRYLQYVSRRNIGSEWPPLDRALTLDCIILRILPDFDGNGGCRPIFRIYGQDPFIGSDQMPKVLFSTPKKSNAVRFYKQADCELVKIDIHCHVQGDVVLECINLDEDQEHEQMIFRVMFNTAFIRSNILMLNRDEIDILWDVKDNFAKDFRAEVLLSDMDSSSSFVATEFASCEDKGGLPDEAFSRVQEMFSHEDWLDSKEYAVQLLEIRTSSSNSHGTLEKVSPRSGSETPQAKQKFQLSGSGLKVKYDGASEAVLSPQFIGPSQFTSETLPEDSASSRNLEMKHSPKVSSPSASISTSMSPRQRKSVEPIELRVKPSLQSLVPPSGQFPLVSSKNTPAPSPPPLPPPPPPSLPVGGSTSTRASNSCAPPPSSSHPNLSCSSSTMSQSYVSTPSTTQVTRHVSNKVNASPPPPPPPPAASASSICSSLPGKKPDGKSPLPPPPPPPARSGSAKPSNASSAPPPPPPNITGRGLSLSSPKNSSSLGTAPKKASLKPLHWVKVTRAMQGSLWAESQKLDESSKAPEFDMSELESLFSAASSTDGSGASKKPGKGTSLSKKPDIVHLVDIRRANNCGIMLTKIKMPLPDLISSVLSLDDSILEIDQVDNLIKSCPTKDEMEVLKGFSGDKESLGKCEQFFLEVMKVPRMESKLRVFSFKIQFRSQVVDLKKNLSIVNSAAEEIRNSVKLKRIMQAILSLGNALNQGTARGAAIGFRLDSLLKLTDTRARNSRMTLMHYLCKVIAEKMPELLDFPKDLTSLEAASKIQLKTLAEEMQAITKGLVKVEQEFTASENDGPISQIFCKTLKEFLNISEAELRTLTSLYSGVGRNADALAHYFGEDPARCPFEQVVSTLITFIKTFVRAHEENLKQIELEKKKAQKEVDAEKAKPGTPRKGPETLLQQLSQSSLSKTK